MQDTGQHFEIIKNLSKSLHSLKIIELSIKIHA